MNNLAQNIGSHPTLSDFALVVRDAQPPSASSIQPLSRLHGFSLAWHNATPIQPELECAVANLIARCHDLKRLKLNFPPQPTIVNSRLVFSEPQALGGFFRGLSSLEVSLRLQRLLVEGILVRAEDFVSHKRHFRFLEDLTIRFEHERPYNLDGIGEVFATLRQEEIHLKRISLTNLHPPGVVEYISSYSGLTGLSIQSHSDHRDDSPTLIHNLFMALKRHQRSLASLSFLVNRISPCLEIPRTHLSEAAESFSALEHLEIEVHTSDEDVERKDAGPLVCAKLEASRGKN
ncbi:hypothetical protein NP233_g12028 [Leucocoprinus birnbaumii]|uniref:Uncharacterized protein n=1 Tax=Leucocoprinus birnbaumii TaxID=56174 RepID=A0AAD5YJU0_9AGAR|nr:hypothetical protein NP233_g12028 [Leucocoprinus birnbaumii]